MSETRYYKVADHVFGVTAQSDDLGLMDNYEPFLTVAGGDVAFSLTIGDGEPVDYAEELRQEDERLRVGEHSSGMGQQIVCGHTADGRAVFEFCWNCTTAGWLVCADGYRDGHLVATGPHRKMAIDNALMVLFALATADKGTALFHAAVVSHAGRAYMFLGPSGTGKSTHARLWLRHIEGTELVNDDNPVVRVVDDGGAVVYGSPWSGKTPCYRNVSHALGGIVLLSQAPYNKIRRLGGIEAYAALVPSISGKRWDAQIADGLHHTENWLAMNVPVWHLECLPDGDAARLCQMITHN